MSGSDRSEREAGGPATPWACGHAARRYRLHARSKQQWRPLDNHSRPRSSCRLSSGGANGGGSEPTDDDRQFESTYGTQVKTREQASGICKIKWHLGAGAFTLQLRNDRPVSERDQRAARGSAAANGALYNSEGFSPWSRTLPCLRRSTPPAAPARSPHRVRSAPA